MSKKNFIEACKETKAYTDMWSRNELNLFCEIMGYPKSEVNSFIGDDPHGIADIMEGYRYFNMYAIHTVISEYEHWMEIYKTNEELRKAVDAWYYYCQEWYNQHSHEEPRWIRVEERLPELDSTQHTTKKNMSVAVVCWDDNIQCDSLGQMFSPMICKYDYERKDWLHVELGCYENEVELGAQITHWKYIQIPSQEAERRKGCPNLRSWLAGCPVEKIS